MNTTSKRSVAQRISEVIRRTVLVVLVAVVLLVGGPWAWVHVEARGHVYSVGAAPAHDVAIVMGAAVWGGVPSPYLRGRLDVAVQLYHAGKVFVIIVSGHREAGYDEPDAMRDYLVEQGIPMSDIVADYFGDDTWASCVRARTVFGVRRAAVVTQTYHLYRSVLACRSAGIDAVGVGDDTQEHSARWWRYQVRELGANIKLIWDATTHREPYLGPASDAVQAALARHR